MSDRQPEIMLVDDDGTIIETLKYSLDRQGYVTSTFRSGGDALSRLNNEVPDLIILDWMLPDMVGPEICKLIRQRRIDVPILMLTGRSRPTDIAAGLVAGADDYLIKPFSTIELMARVKALLRRAAPKGKKSRLVAGGLVLDKDSRRVLLHEKPIDLAPREFKLLSVLMENSGRTLSTETLLNEVWGLDFEGDVKTVAVHVRWLRQKLESDPKNPRIVETVHKAGYRLNPA